MSLYRIPEYPTLQPRETTESYLKRLRDRVQEEAAQRIEDFDILQLANVGWVDVREYGATGDGSTDDTVAIQAAIDKAKKIYIPGGFTFIVSNLTIPSGTHIYGDGWKSIIKHKASSTDHMLELEDVNVYGAMISDVFLDGNQANQSSSIDVVHLDNSSGSFTYADDPIHTLRNVIIYQPKQDGIHIAGGSDHTQGCYLSNVQVFEADRYGFYLDGADNTYVGCIAGNCDNHGFYIDEGTSVFLGCMSYGSGVDAVASVDGFYVDANATGTRMIGCQGQENHRHGIHLYGGGGHLLAGCLTDNNDDTGLVLANSTQYSTITSHKSVDNTTAAMNVGAGSNFNKIQIMVGSDTITWSEAKNSLEVNNQMGYQSLTEADPLTPDPYYGARMNLTLTGDIDTFNVPSRGHAGMRISFAFLQDGSGGHTVTLAAGYKTTWTPSETASKYDIIEFEYDGTSWIEVASTVGVG